MPSRFPQNLPAFPGNIPESTQHMVWNLFMEIQEIHDDRFDFLEEGEGELADWIICKLLTKPNVYNPAKFERLIRTAVGTEAIRITGDDDPLLGTTEALEDYPAPQSQHSPSSPSFSQALLPQPSFS
ncbi:hypothetical protein F5B21DRAFT_510098 [Xylaria acuta]|nr:hypothetical protein F5B21DRAFT_510098 [Xylaria acuta]